MGLDFGGLAGLWLAPLKRISLPVFGGITGVINIYACGFHHVAFSDEGSLELTNVPPQRGQLFERLISNQVGLPAELKHINKRRKRN